MKKVFRLTIAGAAIGLIAACAHQSPNGSQPPAAKDGKTGSRPISTTLLNELALMATSSPGDEAAMRSVVTDADLDRYIDTLVNDTRFAADVAPQILMPHLLELTGNYIANMAVVADNSSGTPVYHLQMKPTCAVADAVDVHPWWAIDTTVKICPDSYQPTHLKTEAKNLYCGIVPMEPYCGCGPNLAFCVKSNEHRNEIKRSVRQEMVSIVSRVVKADDRIEQVYLTNETERDRNAEFIYRRWRISSGEPSEKVLAKLEEWPTTPVLAPRYESSPRQHAGVLTAAGTHEMEAGLRPRMKWFYETLWCDEPPPGGVTTEAVLSLKGNDVRLGGDWQQLAAKPICTDCHARLDYGTQFFAGYGVLFAYNPKDHLDGKGKLFGANIQDYRGEASLDPRSFGELAVAQREFSECVIKRVKRHVVDDSWDTSNDAALRTAFSERHSLKALMRAALRLHADKRRHGTQETAAAQGMASVEAGFQTYCTTCHGPKRAPDLRNSSDPETLKAALQAVAFGKMPRSSMPTGDRRRLSQLLIDRIWTDEPSRVEARKYFLNGAPAHVHTIPGILNAVDAKAGAHGQGHFSSVAELALRSDLLKYSAGVEAIISLEALEACKAAGHRGAALEQCLERATDLRNTTRAGE